jgi:hypothetical protein
MAEQEALSLNTALNAAHKFGRDVLQADRRAAPKDKDGKHGPRPSERLAGSVVMAILGFGLELASDKLAPKVIKELGKRLDVEDFTIPDWAKEAVGDGGVAIAYAVVQKQLGEQLPKLKPQDLLTLGVDVAAYGGDRVVDRIVKYIRSANATSSESEQGDPEKFKLLATITNWLNPVTAGAMREGASAGMDLWNAYRDVVSGVPEKAEEKKEPAGKETTIIFLGTDQQLQSALSTVAGEQAAAS